MDGIASQLGWKVFRSGLAVAWISCLSTAAAPAGGPPALPFESLQFKASKAVIFSGKVRIEARVLSTEEARAELRSCPDDEAKGPDGDHVILLDATTKAPFHSSQELTWIDRSDQGVLQTIAVRKGRRRRLIRATGTGHHQWTRRPTNKREGKRSLDDWTDRSEKHVAWPTGAASGARSSSFGLIYQAAALRLDVEGASAQVRVFSKGELHEVTLTAEDLVAVDVNLQREEGGVLQRVRGERELRRVTVTGDVVGAEDSESPVGLLGMSSGIELFLEPGTGLPLEIRGVVPKLGALRVRLVEAVLP